MSYDLVYCFIKFFIIFFFLVALPVVEKKKNRKSKGSADEKSLGELQAEIPFFIKPSVKAATIDSSKWPLLLKVNISTNYVIFNEY